MMEQSTQVRSSDPMVAPLDADGTGARLAPSRYARRRTAEADLLADDSIPLFLSGPADGAHEPDFDDDWQSHRKTAVFWPRSLKTGVAAATLMALAFALFSVQSTRAVIANASASLAGAWSLGSDAAAQSQPPKAQASSAAPALAPTRAEIAVAFQTALQGQTETRQPAAVPQPASVPQPAAVPPPARRLDADELATLLKRANGLIATGDIASARLLLERAADAHEARAALILAQTYDPAVLGTPDARSITPDPAVARLWYQKAAQFGSQAAQQRLDQMQN
jgi:hypothetical protein